MNEDDQIPPWTLGWRLQRALSWADMNTEEMAYELGVARSTVSRWCNDKGHPTRGYLKLWALRTRVPLNWLIEGDSGLPRVDSNHQPAGMWNDDHPNGRALIGQMAKRLSPEDEAMIRQAIPIRPRALSP